MCLDIMVSMSKSLNRLDKRNQVDLTFLEQLEDIDSMASLTDLLKFLQSDKENIMIQCQRIQTMLQDSKKFTRDDHVPPQQQDTLQMLPKQEDKLVLTETSNNDSMKIDELVLNKNDKREKPFELFIN